MSFSFAVTGRHCIFHCDQERWNDCCPSLAAIKSFSRIISMVEQSGNLRQFTQVITEGKKSSGFSVDSNVLRTIVNGGFKLRKPIEKRRDSEQQQQADISKHQLSIYVFQSLVYGFTRPKNKPKSFLQISFPILIKEINQTPLFLVVFFMWGKKTQTVPSICFKFVIHTHFLSFSKFDCCTNHMFSS